jgi:hypothetical protein
VETELIADGTVQTITLYRTAVISGKVIDDATGDRISPVELVPSGQTGPGV